MEQLGLEVDKVHSTRLKERLLAEFPDMRAYTKGRDVLKAFEDDIGTDLTKACEITAGLGPEKARSLPVFHALTG